MTSETFLVERTGSRGEFLGAAEFGDREDPPASARQLAINAAARTWRRGRSATVVVRDANYDVIFARFAGPHSTKGRRIR